MYTNSLAMSYAMRPASQQNTKRAVHATLAFATGALCGWPFALLVSLPYVFEELFLRGEDPSIAVFLRARRWLGAVLLASLLAVPIVMVDSLAYGRLTAVPLNTILYNVLGRARGIGPELYGVEPPSYYLVALVLGLSVAAPLALASLPLLGAAALWLPSRLPKKAGSSPLLLLTCRLLPAYLWLSVLWSQAHKEERFLFPVYPLLCFNAAVALYFIRAFLEQIYLRVTRSPYRTSRTILFSSVMLVPLLVSVLLGLGRTLAVVHHYGAPMDIGLVLSQVPSPDSHTLCYGKEWHRFPSHFFVPPSMRVEFIESAFTGILPHHFRAGQDRLLPRSAKEEEVLRLLDVAKPLWPWADYTRQVPHSVNERNAAEPDRFVRTQGSHQVPLDTCTLIVDFDTPWHEPDAREPAFLREEAWEPVICKEFLDADASRAATRGLPLPHKVRATLARTLWLPPFFTSMIPGWDSELRYGEYCLLKRRALSS